MFLLKIIASLSVVAAATADCIIHEEDHFYYNISDLGLAALDNRVDDVDGLLADGCDVNYNGTSVVLEYSYSENDYEYGDYEYEYGEYGDANVVVDGMTALHIAATEGNNAMVLVGVGLFDLFVSTKQFTITNGKSNIRSCIFICITVTVFRLPALSKLINYSEQTCIFKHKVEN